MVDGDADGDGRVHSINSKKGGGKQLASGSGLVELTDPAPSSSVETPEA